MKRPVYIEKLYLETITTLGIVVIMLYILIPQSSVRQALFGLASM